MLSWDPNPITNFHLGGVLRSPTRKHMLSRELYIRKIETHGIFSGVCGTLSMVCLLTYVNSDI